MTPERRAARRLLRRALLAAYQRETHEPLPAEMIALLEELEPPRVAPPPRRRRRFLGIF